MGRLAKLVEELNYSDIYIEISKYQSKLEVEHDGKKLYVRGKFSDVIKFILKLLEPDRRFS